LHYFQDIFCTIVARSVTVTVIYLLSTIIKHYKAACTINELDSKAALLHLQLPTN